MQDYTHQSRNIEGWQPAAIKAEISTLRAEGCFDIENISGYMLRYKRPAAPCCSGRDGYHTAGCPVLGDLIEQADSALLSNIDGGR